jgi:hypothetical protein
VVCKLSGAHSKNALAADLRPYYEIVHAAFGPSRLMFGSDRPVSSLTAPYGQVCQSYRELTADLGPAGRDAIFDGTARRIYGLRLPGAADVMLAEGRVSRLTPVLAWPGPRETLTATPGSSWKVRP